jgi:Arc/MetJ family transcription regulator
MVIFLLENSPKRTQIRPVRITIDIDDETLAQAMKLTGESKKGPAINKAVNAYVRRQMARKFATMVMEGEFEDYPLTNDELESADR